MELEPLIAMPVFIQDFLCIHSFNEGNVTKRYQQKAAESLMAKLRILNEALELMLEVILSKALTYALPEMIFRGKSSRASS